MEQEKEYDIQITRGKDGKDIVKRVEVAPSIPMTRDELREANREYLENWSKITGRDIEELLDELLDCWGLSDTSNSFI